MYISLLEVQNDVTLTKHLETGASRDLGTASLA